MPILISLAKKVLQPSGLLRYAPYLLILPIIVFHALSLTGCVSTSPAIPNIYVVDLRSNTNVTEDLLKVRIGYYGICGIDEDGTRCQSASGRSVETLASNLFPNLNLNTTSNSTSNKNNNTPQSSEITDLISTALDLQSRTFISVLAAAAVLFILGIGSLILLQRDVASSAASYPDPHPHPRRSTIIRRVTYALLFGSTGLVFAAALATSQSAGALEYASEGMNHASVLIKSGTTLQVLQWITFGFEVLFVLAVPFLVRYRGVGVAAGGYKEEA
ncbi:Ca2+ regulator and membrane fusion protein Fig1-domain-containing protein [Chaetomium tenue]|uniref:Ca2+ regulator and membrane fusion protein Fig1-domain-containing protein n=1 Tax=Chaetomium tenue TaxID=1854479 RepID=A0ACB7PK39_9PEZI|nr:Ca2+ regulator and membrane fusion protein Fig1-domain-containing protein [Chaetomium globosum]